MLDVLVVGAGLAGLCAGVAAARAGCEVLVVDALDRPGGLCGTWSWAGHAVPRACEEFGQPVFDVLRSYGQPVAHRPSRGRLAGAPAGSWLGTVPALARATVAQSIGDAIGDEAGALERTLATMTAMAGVPPHRASMATLRAKVVPGRHWLSARRRRPVADGPQAVTDALVAALEAAGGELRLRTRVDDLEVSERRVSVRSGNERITAAVAVSCRPDWSAWPDDAPAPLELAQVLFRVPRAVTLPDDLDCLFLYPAPIRGWMHTLDAGAWPAGGPGVGLFRTTDPDADTHVIGAYVLTPRGEERWRDADARLDEIVDRITSQIPGFRDGVQDRILVDPAAFRARHGLSPLTVGRVRPPGFVPPEQGRGRLLPLSSSVLPAIDHTDAAVLGGRHTGRLAAHIARKTP